MTTENKKTKTKNEPATLRDQFAMHALVGIVQKHGMGQGSAWTVTQAWEVADRMMETR